MKKLIGIIFALTCFAVVTAPVIAETNSVKTSKAESKFRDCADCPEMIIIPAGTFERGDGRTLNSKNLHTVSLKSFAMGKTEVTQGQWKAIMGSNPSSFSKCGDNCPVDKVSWEDVQEYIQKLNAKTGKQYRLPSEAEWEYACRAGGKHLYCGSDDLDSVAWYGPNLKVLAQFEAPSGGNSNMTTHPVATKQANGFGLYDMTGNVLEWLDDVYFDDFIGAPTDGTARQNDGSKRTPHRVLRGGWWHSHPQFSLASRRTTGRPNLRDNSYGFRLAQTLP